MIHLIDSVCRSHRLTIRSRFSANMLAASHGYDDAYPTIVTVAELKHGVCSPEKLKSLRENGGLALEVNLTVDNAEVFETSSNQELITPAEKTLLGHVMWIKELLKIGLLKSIRHCNAKDMIANGHINGVNSRVPILEAMHGRHKYLHRLQSYPK